MKYIIKYFLNVIFCTLTIFTSGCFQRKDNVLRIGNSVEASTFDPNFGSSLQEANIIFELFEGLLVADGKTLQPLPGMAQSWTRSSDGLEYTFILRDNIFWTNGDAVTAGDFVNTIERGLSKDIASPWIDLYFVLKNAQRCYHNEVPFSEVGVEVISPKILKFTLEHPTDYFLSLLTHWAWSPINRKNIEQFGNFFDRNNRWTRAENIVTNGPYLLKSHEIGNKVVLQKNERYWDAHNISIDQVEFFGAIEPSTEDRMFRTKQLDITESVLPDKISLYREQGTLQSTAALGSSFYWFNCQKKPFNDIRVRKALSLAIDRRAIGELRKRGPGFEAYALVPPGTMYYNSQPLFQEDVEYARQLLAEAGYPDGKGFPEFTILYNTSESWRMISEAVQDMWRKNLNLHVHLQSTEWGVFLNDRRHHSFDICRGGWIGDFNDATTFLNLLCFQNNNNHAQWNNATYNQLLLQASQENDSNRRSKILAESEVLIIDEMPIIPLYFDSHCHLVSPRIDGWYSNILDWHPLKFVSFK